MEKLELSQDLVRKSLTEVRKAVRMLKEPADEQDFRVAMFELLEETKAAAGVEIECDLSPLPELTALQKNALYRALQEGLTNGIRHGGSTKFTFRLSCEEGRIRFFLSNNGRKFEAQQRGFGLQSMERRVLQLGGRMSVSAADEKGCVILITFPAGTAKSSA